MRLDVLYNEDCLLGMQRIPDVSVDMILCDLPYGTTDCKWDSVIPFEPLWEQYGRIAKKNAAIVLTASQPFTTKLIASNLKHFRYCWVWDKDSHANFAQAKHRPLKVHEDICVFSYGKEPYFPIKTFGKPNHTRKAGREPIRKFMSGKEWKGAASDVSGMKYPKSIQKIPKHSSQCGLHPAQKPVALFEYLIRTYTNKGETVLDNCMGSGTTAIACINTGRHYIGFEKDPEYFAMAQNRIREHRTDQLAKAA